MLYDLLNMPLGDWHPREGYANEALRRQQAQSLRGVIGLYEQFLQEGVIPYAEANRPYRVRFDNLFAYARKADPMNIGRMSEKAFAQELDKLGIKRERPGGIRYRDFPPLTKAREEFAKTMRGWRWRYDLTDWLSEGAEATILGGRLGL
jgi:hypothetical protein